jgi:hydroxymethylpyrimidine pyrophosphatase-like HAD family hydrolase
VRATSPFDYRSLWVEVFSKQAAKHLAADVLAKELGISAFRTLAIGNDYNDEDLLEWACKSFVGADGIQRLRDRYEIVAEAKSDGFSAAMERLLK